MLYYLSALKKFVDFKSRASRKEYWMFVLLNAAFMHLLCFVIIVMASVKPDILRMIPVIIAGLYFLAVILPSLAIAVRRLHDTGRSGLYVFINFIPVIGTIWFIVLMVLDGQNETNQYGDNPKEEDYGVYQSKSLIVLSIIWIAVVCVCAYYMNFHYMFTLQALIFPAAVLAIGVNFYIKEDETIAGIILAVPPAVILFSYLSTLFYPDIQKVFILLNCLFPVSLLITAVLWIMKKKVYCGFIACSITAYMSLLVFVMYTATKSFSSYGEGVLFHALWNLIPFFYLFLTAFIVPVKNSQLTEY